MVEEKCVRCAPALDGVYDGERCILLNMYSCVERISFEVRVHVVEVMFVTRSCGEMRADVLVSAVALHVWG